MVRLDVMMLHSSKRLLIFLVLCVLISPHITISFDRMPRHSSLSVPQLARFLEKNQCIPFQQCISDCVGVAAECDQVCQALHCVVDEKSGETKPKYPYGSLLRHIQRQNPASKFLERLKDAIRT
eukprot:TRINITY_DN1887_c0_g1_i3.p1 TRINITY_DN1887_c0_g1~~TRINITY_DN1887_c0_g1_i3.p1  ORF type:complete len:124 (+),score=22.20 TRINITY_DN1887_c0_g1_i3:70-441(+)